MAKSKVLFLISGCLLSIVVSSFAAENYTLHPDKSFSFTLSNGNQMREDLARFIDAYSIETSSIVVTKRTRSNDYLLITAEGPSKGTGNGQCGAGIEATALWVEVRDWKIRGVRSIPYESCWNNISGGQVNIFKSSASVSSFGPDGDKEYILNFEKSENGFSVRR